MRFRLLFILLIILAVVTVTQYFNKLAADTKTGSTSAFASLLSSANILNYMTRYKNPKLGVAIGNCTDMVKAINGGLPAGYSIVSVMIPANVTALCTLKGPSATTGFFSGTGIK